MISLLADAKARLGVKLSEHRRRNGMSLEALSSASKVDKQTLWRIEKGRTWPEFPTLVAACGALGIQPEELFDWGVRAEITPEEALAVLAREMKARTSRQQIDPETLSPLKQELLRLITARDEPDSKTLRTLLERFGADPTLAGDLAAAGLKSSKLLSDADGKSNKK